MLYCCLDTYFLINWLDDPDGDDLYDMVNSKLVVPPEGTDILDVAPSSVCRVAYSGQFYKAKVLQTGVCVHACIYQSHVCACMNLLCVYTQPVNYNHWNAQVYLVLTICVGVM